MAFREARARPCISIMTRRCSIPCTHMTVTAPWQKSTQSRASSQVAFERDMPTLTSMIHTHKHRTWNRTNDSMTIEKISRALHTVAMRSSISRAVEPLAAALPTKGRNECRRLPTCKRGECGRATSQPQFTQLTPSQRPGATPHLQVPSAQHTHARTGRSDPPPHHPVLYEPALAPGQS